MSFFDQLGDMLAAKRLAESRAATLLPFIPDDQGNLQQSPQVQAPGSGGFFDRIFGGLGAGPAQMAPAASPAPSPAPAPVASPAANPFAFLAPAAASGQQPPPVAWDKSRQSGGVLSQLLGPQPSAPLPVSSPGADVTGSTLGAPAPDVPLPPVRPAFPSSVPTRTGGMVADRSPAPNGLPTFAAGASMAAAPQPDNTPNDAPMYGRSSADSLPTFAALQGAPTKQPSSGTPSAMFSGLEQRFNLPAGYLGQTYQIESGGNPNAHNKGSGAAGGFQFVPSTARQYGLSNPYDLLQSSYAAARLASDNATVLRNALGRDPTAGELYLAHQQGSGGAAKLLTNPDAPASSIVGASAVKSNGGTSDMTAGQFASKWTSRFGAPGPIGTQSTSVGPYGALGGAPDGTPTMVAAGMPLTNATPLSRMTAQDTPAAPAVAGTAYSAAGQPVRTDADGNALDSNGQPTALAFSAPANRPAAPAARAINLAAPAASDDDDAQPDAPVQVPRRGPGTAVAGSIAAPRMQQPSPAPAPAAGGYQAPAAPAAPASARSMQRGDYGMSITPNMIRALIANSDTQDLGIKLLETMATTKTAPIIAKEGDVILDGRTGQPIYSVPTKPAATDAIKNYQFGQANPGFAQYQDNQKAAEKGQIIDVPLPNGQFQKTWITPGQAPSEGVAVGAPYVPKPANQVSIDQKAESSQEGEVGKAIGQEIGETLKAGATAPAALNTIRMMRAAAASGGDNLSTGPFGQSMLKAKQAIGNALNIEIPGTSEGEVLNNLGYGLATQAARAISNRPTQFEFGQALAVKPGLAQSKAGFQALLNIRQQDLEDQLALGKLASVKANRDNWLAVKSQYYAEHPVMSPFDPTQPLGANDVQAINGSQQQQAAPQSISSQDASALPTISSPDAAARLKPGTRFKTPDGRIMQR